MTKSFAQFAPALGCCGALAMPIVSGCAQAIQPRAGAAPENFALVGYSPAPPLSATAFQYYVSPAGDDSTSGSREAPFRTLARSAAAVASAAAASKSSGVPQGITVWVAPGIYQGGFKTTASGDAAPADRIYYVSTTKWGAKIVPPATDGPKSAWDNRGNYVSIVGFDVDGSQPGTGAAWRYGLYSGGSYTRFQNNRVHHIAATVPCTSAGGSAIGIDGYYKGVQGEVTDNVVHDIGRAGCRFVQGIYISTSAVVKNNMVYRVGAAGIHLWHDANNVVVANNTVSWSTHGIIVGGGDFYWRTIGADHIRVQNNVLHDNTYGVVETGKTGCNNMYSDNLAVSNTYNWSLKPCTINTISVHRAALSVVQSRLPEVPDPQVKSRSPPIGRAAAIPAYRTDVDDVDNVNDRGKGPALGNNTGECAPSSKQAMAVRCD